MIFLMRCKQMTLWDLIDKYFIILDIQFIVLYIFTVIMTVATVGHVVKNNKNSG